MFEHISRMHISLVAPHKIVQLVSRTHIVRAPAQEVNHMGRVIILQRPEALLAASVLNGEAKEEIEEDVKEAHYGTESTHDPVEYPRVDLHEHAQKEAWGFWFRIHAEDLILAL